MTRRIWLLDLIVASCVVLVTLPILAYAAADEHTVAIWLFDEGSGDTVKDASGNGHDGKFVGSPKWTDAKHGKGLDFNGDATVYVEVPHADDLNLEKWTIEGWLLVRSVVGGWDCPLCKGDG